MLPRGSWDDPPTLGEPIPPLVTVDADGEPVDLYDLAGDVPIVVDMSTEWCGICREIAAWLAGAHDPSSDAEWPGVPGKSPAARSAG